MPESSKSTGKPAEGVLTVSKPETSQKEQKISPLSAEERELFETLEHRIQDSLHTAACALKAIRDRRLYREGYTTFEAYCQDRLSISKRFADYQINYATVVENLKQWEQDVPLLPTSESQVRALGRFTPEKQRDLWMKSVEKAKGSVPSRETVQEVVQEERRLERAPSVPVKVGDCVRIRGQTVPQYRNRWGFVKNVTDRGYDIELPDTTLSGLQETDIVAETLDGRPLSKQQTETKQKIFDRLAEIYAVKQASDGTCEDLIEYLLVYFTKMKTKPGVSPTREETRSVKLTSLEERMLTAIEKEVNKEDKE